MKYATNHEALRACERACFILGMKKIHIQPMRRNAPVKKGSFRYTVGHTQIGKNIITLDFDTPRKRQPKKISAILRVLAHEIAHHQKKPYKERYRGRWITRIHYPEFYRQVNSNIVRIKKDRELALYFL